MRPQLLFSMALADVDSAITGVDTLLAELCVDRPKQMQANGELDTQIRPAELKPFVVFHPEHGIFGVRYNETYARFAQNRDAAGLPRLAKNSKTLYDIEQGEICPVVELVNEHSLGQNNVLVDGLTLKVSTHSNGLVLSHDGLGMNEVHFEGGVLFKEVTELKVVLRTRYGMGQQAGAPTFAVMEIHGMQGEIIPQRGLRHTELDRPVALRVVAPR